MILVLTPTFCKPKWQHFPISVLKANVHSVEFFPVVQLIILLFCVCSTTWRTRLVECAADGAVARQTIAEELDAHASGLITTFGCRLSSPIRQAVVK